MNITIHATVLPRLLGRRLRRAHRRVPAAHGSAPISVIVLAYMLGQLGNALPLPGGVGGIEPIMLGVLTASGVNLGLGAAAIILYRFVSLGIQATAGAVAVAALPTTLQRPPQAG